MSFNLLRGCTSPPQSVPYGFQNDGSGQLHLAVAHTPHGDIPCKAKGSQAWYPYGGNENLTNNFSYVDVAGSTTVSGQPHNPPPGAILCGNQNDGSGQYYGVIAHTPHGNIPGKAKPGTAWYAYGGKEHTTSDFAWIVSSGYGGGFGGGMGGGFAQPAYGGGMGMGQPGYGGGMGMGGGFGQPAYGGGMGMGQPSYGGGMGMGQPAYGGGMGGGGGSGTLAHGQTLTGGNSIWSTNGQYQLIMQADGNLVGYHNGQAFWNSQTCGKGNGPFRCVMQTDGNLVVYDSANTPTWNSQTCGRGTPPYRLAMQTDRNIVVYDAGNQPLWNSHTQC